MSRKLRAGIATAPTGEALDALGRPATASEATFSLVEGEVQEVLHGYGLAHVRALDGSTYGLNRETPGVSVTDLREGQRVRVKVARKFNRVLHAQLIG